MTDSSPRSWSRRYVLAAALPFCWFGGAAPSIATPLNTLKPLDLPTPNTAITDAEGNSLTLADYRPMPLVVNFWASWCPPCIHELPALARLDEVLTPQGMGVLLVGVDRKGRDFGESFLKDQGIDIRQRAYDAKGGLVRAIGVRAMPTSLLISGSGRIIGRFEGIAAWNDPEIIAHLADLLAS